MNQEELESRMEGIDDLARILIWAMRNIGILANRPLENKDLENLKEMLLGLRNLLEVRYKKEIEHG
jgi:hypothetical protein